MTDHHWAILEPLLPPAKPGGRSRTTDLRQVMNAIWSVDRTGGQWRALPHDFPRLYDGVELFPHLAERSEPGSASRRRCENRPALPAGAQAHPQRGDD